MSEQTNRWRGLFIGMAGSLAGLMTMQVYWQYVAPKVEEKVKLGGRMLIHPRSNWMIFLLWVNNTKKRKAQRRLWAGLYTGP